MQVRYQAALRPGNAADYIRARLLQTLQKESGAQNVQYLLDIAAHRHGKFIRCALVCIRRLIKTCAGAAASFIIPSFLSERFRLSPSNLAQPFLVPRCIRALIEVAGQIAQHLLLA